MRQWDFLMSVAPVRFAGTSEAASTRSPRSDDPWKRRMTHPRIVTHGGGGGWPPTLLSPHLSRSTPREHAVWEPGLDNRAHNCPCRLSGPRNHPASPAATNPRKQPESVVCAAGTGVRGRSLSGTMWRWLKRSLVPTALPLPQARLVSIAVGGCTPPSLAGESPLTMSRTEPSLLRLPVLGGE